MGQSGPAPRITLEDTLDAFDRLATAGEPITATEMAEVLDCARRTAYDKLDALAERGDLCSKKTGARGRIWWRPPDELSVDRESDRPIDREQFDELVRAVTEYAIFVLDAEGTVRSWNNGAERIKGYSADDIIGEHFSTFYTDEDVAAGVPERNLAHAEVDGQVQDEGWRVREDGGRFWANVTITSLRDEAGELRGFMKVTRDMTERREYEQRLRAEKERFESLVQEVENYAIFMLDPDGYVQSWNRGIERIKGYREDEIVGEHFSVFYPPEAREAGVPERNLAAAAEDGRVEDEGLRVRKDGTEFRANVVITALRDDDGDLRGFAKVTRDVTEQYEYEQQLLHQRNELDELNRINADIRDIDKAIVSATTRAAIEQTVCDRLAASGAYGAAVIGEYRHGTERLTPRAWAGLEAATVDRLDAADGAAVERELGTTALATRTVQTAVAPDDPGSTAPEARRPLGGFDAVAAIPLVHEDVEYGVLDVYTDTSGFDARKTAVLGEFGETIGHAIAALERKEREQTLTDLHGSTRDLLHAETAAEIGEVTATAATEYLELSAATVYHFDTTDNVLVPLTERPRDEDGRAPPSFTPGDEAPVWTSFVDGETIVADPDGGAVYPDGESRHLRSTMVVPLGDQGVLAVGSTDRGRFGPDTQKLVELLAATTQAAFTRVDNEANLRERDTLLQEQNRRLQRLNRLNAVVREVDQRLVGATSREEIHREVCELLTTYDRFRLAWIVDLDTASDRLSPLAWHGTGQGYLDGVAFDGDIPDDEPAARTARTGETTVVSNIADDLRSATWRKEAFSREIQSAISVPIRYGDRRFGALTVYADRPGLFGEMEQSVFAELGHTIANAINTVDIKQALLTDRTVELEFELPTDADSVLVQLARRTGHRIEFEGAIPAGEDGVRLFFTTHGGDPEDVLSAFERSVALESGRLITTRDDDSLFEVVVSGHAIVSRLIEHNATLRTLTATSEAARVTVELPASADVRDFIALFQTDYPGVEFVARRERDRPMDTREGFRSQLESRLTDRQLEVLQLAYYGGFFESPRGSSGRDLAESLGVSQPTVASHLRAAERKLLDLVLEGE